MKKIKNLLYQQDKLKILLFLLIIFFYLFIQTASAQSIPTNPTLSQSVAGTTVSLSWSADNADKYVLYAAPYPDASVIYDFDMGTQTSASFDLPYGSAYYVAIRASNSAGLSGWSNVEYFDLSQKTPPTSGCGAYVAPGVWKDFDCYNLAAIGKTTNDDPFTPSWRLIGGYWQWGRKGPDPSQWYDTNTEHFAHGPTGPGDSEANDNTISGWDKTDAPDGSWSDTTKTANDPCPAGYRVPTISQWDGVLNNNTQSTVGTWSNSPTNYSAARFFGNDLMLPAAGYHSSKSGPLKYRGYFGYYLSSLGPAGSGYCAGGLGFLSSTAGASSTLRRRGHSVRCVAE
jgi:hypothetical protein